MELIGFTLFALGLKLMTSLDDTIWLPKLLHKEVFKNKVMIELVYLASLCLIVCLAYFTFLVGDVVFASFFGEAKLFAMISSLGLMGFAYFYLKNDNNEDNDEIEQNSQPLFDKLKIAFVVSILGSMDEFIVFIVMFSTKAVTFLPLMIGTILAGLIVILFSNSILKVNFFASIIQKIPVWMVIFVVGLVAFVLSF